MAQWRKTHQLTITAVKELVDVPPVMTTPCKSTSFTTPSKCIVPDFHSDRA